VRPEAPPPANLVLSLAAQPATGAATLRRGWIGV
jgi:hypothetical protein